MNEVTAYSEKEDDSQIRINVDRYGSSITRFTMSNRAALSLALELMREVIGAKADR